MRLPTTLLACLCLSCLHAQTLPDSSAVAIPGARIEVNGEGDSVCVRDEEQPGFFKNLFKRTGQGITDIVKGLNSYNADYIQRDGYNWTIMAQNSYFFQIVRFTTKDPATGARRSLSFAPQTGVKIGPYVGWRWIFLGYAFDVSRPKRAGKSSEFSLSIYTRKIGVDLMYIRQSENFNIRHTRGFEGITSNQFRGTEFDGIKTRTTSINAYYIFNHRRFSYPAAFNQSTVQRRSAGSVLLGLRYDHQSIDFDYTLLPQQLADAIEANIAATDLTAKNISYTNFSVCAGYAYNWVPARNWLVAASLTPAIGLKKLKGQRLTGEEMLNQMKNFNIDFVGRLGVVWNTGKAFVGASFISHLFDYNTKSYSFNNSVSYLNIYGGIYLGPRKWKKKQAQQRL